MICTKWPVICHVYYCKAGIDKDTTVSIEEESSDIKYRYIKILKSKMSKSQKKSQNLPIFIFYRPCPWKSIQISKYCFKSTILRNIIFFKTEVYLVNFERRETEVNNFL